MVVDVVEHTSPNCPLPIGLMGVRDSRGISMRPTWPVCSSTSSDVGRSGLSWLYAPPPLLATAAPTIGEDIRCVSVQEYVCANVCAYVVDAACGAVATR